MLTDKKMTIVVYMGMTAAPVDPRGPAGRRPLAANAGRRVRAGDAAGRAGRGRHARTICPALVDRIDGGPAILIIGDVVAHSAPWRLANSNLADPNQVISNLLEAAE